MKPLVIYHANCADGFGAAFAAWLKLGDEAEYLPMQYNQPHTADYNGREIYILDFSFHKEMMDYVFAHAKRVVWLDHHKTAFEMWCKDDERQFFEWAFVSEPENNSYIKLNNKSGAMLAWEYFHPDIEVPMLIKHIDDYDRWQFKLKGTKEFMKALWSYAPWSFELWRDILNITEKKEWIAASADPQFSKGYTDMLLEGAAILRAHEVNVQAVVKGAGRSCRISKCTKWVHSSKLAGDSCFVEGLAANCPPHLASDVGHELAIRSGTYGLLWHIDKDGICKCSLRSNGDYDVSAIAKSFGGGGHKSASGMEVDIQTLLEWIE